MSSFSIIHFVSGISKKSRYDFKLSGRSFFARNGAREDRREEKEGSDEGTGMDDEGGGMDGTGRENAGGREGGAGKGLT